MLSKIINNIDTTNKQTTIDTSTTYQTIEGFGALLLGGHSMSADGKI